MQHLRRQNFTAFFPFCLIKTKNRHYSVQPFFSGYIFVRLEEEIEDWSPINFTTGVNRLLTDRNAQQDSYRKPCRVDFIDDLHKKRISMDDLYRRRIRDRPDGAQDLIPEGTMVRVKRGPFVDRIALVSSSTEQRAALMLQVMNREIEIEFEIADIECIASPEQ